MFSTKLKKLRKQRGLTQGELAKILGLTPSAIGNYEQGTREPEAAVIIKIANYFGVGVDFLINDNSDEPTELLDYITQVTNELMAVNGIMLNGELLDESEIAKIADAIRTGLRITLNEQD